MLFSKKRELDDTIDIEEISEKAPIVTHIITTYSRITHVTKLEKLINLKFFSTDSVLKENTNITQLFQCNKNQLNSMEILIFQILILIKL